jgi:hypothetical protein
MLWSLLVSMRSRSDGPAIRASAQAVDDIARDTPTWGFIKKILRWWDCSAAVGSDVSQGGVEPLGNGRQKGPIEGPLGVAVEGRGCCRRQPRSARSSP